MLPLFWFSGIGRRGQKDITIQDNVTRCGSGAFKDVFMLDNYNFVVKMNTNAETKREWGAEQHRFDKYKRQSGE